jgi:hypothetical protein
MMKWLAAGIVLAPALFGAVIITMETYKAVKKSGPRILIGPLMVIVWLSAACYLGS